MWWSSPSLWSAQEVHLDAVGLVLNAVVLWTPRNLDAAVLRPLREPEVDGLCEDDEE
ncbi:hypothetical protein ACFW1M_33785 [Streptomyces inhibens]|uniref:hypothetical protein n=1 Tax=Streptomyces inhibens TaxID=2293571 RepID=UPI0036C63117